MAGETYPFDPALAAAMVEEWQGNASRQAKPTPRELIRRIVADAISEPMERDYLLLGLQPYQILKRKAFIRHFRSARTYVWKRVLLDEMPDRVDEIMDAVDGALMAAGGNSPKNWTKSWYDLLLYDEIVDNFSEDGFLSLALHVVQRILGDIEKQPDNLVVAVGYADHLDRSYQTLRDEIGLGMT